MAITMRRKHFYEFAQFQVVPEERALLRDGQIVPLAPKAFEVLLVLLQNSGRLVSKDELMKTVWPDTFVEEANLSQSIFLLRRALGEKANEPHYVVTVPGRGYRFGEEVIEVSDGEPSVPTLAPTAVPMGETKPPRFLFWSGLALLLVVAAGGGYLVQSLRRIPLLPGSRPTPTLKARRSVAVLGFHNRSGRPEEAWLSTALSEMLSTEMAAGEHLRMVPTEEVARVKLEISLADADSLSKSTLARLRANLGSDVVVIGSYAVVRESATARIRMDLRLQDAGSGEMIAEFAATGTEGDLFDLVSQCGAQLREKLGVEARSTAEALNVHASLPSNPEAARLYSEGLARLRVFDALLARDLLREAVAADPTYPMSHSALASAWSALGYDLRAKEEAVTAFRLSSKLSREERLLVEGSYHEVAKEWTKAVENYRTLFALFPDNIDYGLRLFQAQVGAANGPEARITLDALRQLPFPASEDARIDLAEVDLAYLLSNFKQMLAAGSHAASQSEAQGARLLLARARQAQGEAFYYLGESSQALASFAEAKEVYVATGDRAHTAGVLRDVADTLALQGDHSAALQLYRQSLEVAREVGSKSQVANDLNNMAVLLQTRRDFATAQRMYEQALAIYREIDDKKRGTYVLCNVGEALFYQGDLTGAEKKYREALESARQIGDSDSEANQVNDIAILLEARGDLSGASSAFEQALSLWHDNNVPGVASAMKGLGDVQLAQGDLIGARKTQQQALAVRQKLGEKQSIAESQLALARVWLEEGRAPEAESAARAAVSEFKAENVSDLEAAGYALLTSSLLAQGKSEEAQKAAKSAMSHSARSQEPMTRISVAIAAARVRASSYRHASSRVEPAVQVIHDLQALANEAKKYAFLGLEFEARLAEAQVTLDSGQTDDGVAQLASLAEAAHAKGFGLIAKKALGVRN
jgi:DNA-binding winged helix-turn-helix (wHTH) protein/tetratricopeptide (TPR) repeat protein